VQRLGHYGEKNTLHADQDPDLPVGCSFTHNDRLAAHYPLQITLHKSMFDNNRELNGTKAFPALPERLRSVNF